MQYPVINVERTGKRIRRICERQGIDAREIQELMGFAARQSVYDWFRGKNLPSLDNLYALSRLLKVPMDKLVAASDQSEPEDACSMYELSPLPGMSRGRILLRYVETLSTSL